MLWHGVSDSRRTHAPRGITALLRQALTHPGSVGTLGRGTAVMPGAHASQLGRPTALMHLASDAVRAASTSPFLEGTQGRGGMVTVLCTLALPPPSPHLSGGSIGGGAEDGQHAGPVHSSCRAVRFGVQDASSGLALCIVDLVELCCAAGFSASLVHLSSKVQ